MKIISGHLGRLPTCERDVSWGVDCGGQDPTYWFDLDKAEQFLVAFFAMWMPGGEDAGRVLFVHRQRGVPIYSLAGSPLLLTRQILAEPIDPEHWQPAAAHRHLLDDTDGFYCTPGGSNVTLGLTHVTIETTLFERVFVALVRAAGWTLSDLLRHAGTVGYFMTENADLVRDVDGCPSLVDVADFATGDEVVALPDEFVLARRTGDTGRPRPWARAYMTRTSYGVPEFVRV